MAELATPNVVAAPGEGPPEARTAHDAAHERWICRDYRLSPDYEERDSRRTDALRHVRGRGGV
jgi:hypothetical protein